jgi:hypothetical protein
MKWASLGVGILTDDRISEPKVPVLKPKKTKTDKVGQKFGHQYWKTELNSGNLV